MNRLKIAALVALVSMCLSGISQAQAQGQEDKCSINPNLCMTEPVASGCPAGKAWSLAGTGIAHCATISPTPAQTPTPTPPPAPAPMPMPTPTPMPTPMPTPTPTCTSTSSTEYAACQAPTFGQRERTVTVDSCTGTTYSAWDISSCLFEQVCTSGRTWDSGSGSCVCPSGTWNGSSCVASPDCQAENYYGSHTQVYGTKSGVVVMNTNGPYIFVGCYGPAITGIDGQIATMACGYYFDKDAVDPLFPGTPPPNGEFKIEQTRTSQCVGGNWTR